MGLLDSVQKIGHPAAKRPAQAPLRIGAGRQRGISVPIPRYDLPPGFSQDRLDPSQRFVRDPHGKFVVNPHYKAEIDRFRPNYAGIGGDLAVVVGSGISALGPLGNMIGLPIVSAGATLREMNGPKE